MKIRSFSNVNVMDISRETGPEYADRAGFDGKGGI